MITAFFITCNLNPANELQASEIICRHGRWNVMVHSGASYRILEKVDEKFFVFGDIINEDYLLNYKFSIQNLKGIFYLIRKTKESLEIYNSMFSILPLFFTEDATYISSNYQWILKSLPTQPLIEKKFILENLLFNYGFFNRTLYKGINLLPANSNIHINKKGGIQILKHTTIADHFGGITVSKKNALNRLTDLFIQNVRDYFPSAPFSITFTGGFDGRTLIACARHAGKSFNTCSFGTKGNDDVEIPKRNAKELKVPYSSYSLHNEHYLSSGYIKHANELTTLSPGFNGLLYPHFAYLAKMESSCSHYLLTGYFGSELFRAIHISGAISSEILKMLFESKNDVHLANSIRHSPRLNYIILDNFRVELEELIEELLVYRNNLNKNLSPNQKFYVFAFEEMLRKVFGTWISAQSKYMNVRTPYLDFEFITELLKSPFAGVNNDFFTGNPFKRLIGQVLYAEIIARTDPIILHQKTGRGYKPFDLIRTKRAINIFLPYLKGRMKIYASPENLDNLGIISGVIINQKSLSSIAERSMDLFNIALINSQLESISPYVDEFTRDRILHCLSIQSTLNLGS